MSSTSSTSLTPEIIKTLSAYTACDISDALLKLNVPNAGFIPDLTPYCHKSLTLTDNPVSNATQQITIGAASTVYFVAKTSSSSSNNNNNNNEDGKTIHPTANIPQDQHWVDLTTPNTIIVSSQPAGQTNAVLGGIMASRMKVLGALGVVVHGRIRDLDELHATGLPIWAKGTSTVGTGASTKPHAVNVPITVAGVEVVPGDVVFCDVKAGVVVIPKSRLHEVLDLLPRITAADEKVKEAVEAGMTVRDAFARFR